MSDSILNSAIVILVEPQDQVNIGATIRAMKNMGLHQLRLVNPVPYDVTRLSFIAHDTREIVDAARHFDSLESAIADCVRVVGFTSRHRSAKREIISPKAAAQQLLEYAPSGPVAMVFGREDRGLSNEQLDLAHAIVRIPTTNYASLNLAQAVLIGLYELHLGAADATRGIDPPRKDAPPASSLQYQKFFEDAERALQEIDFFKTRYKEHVMRTVRSLAYRAAPDAREIDFIRAMAIEVLRTIERVQKSRTPQ